MSNPFLCPSCDRDDDTLRLGHPEMKDGGLREVWICEKCGEEYSVRYTVEEKKSISGNRYE